MAGARDDPESGYRFLADEVADGGHVASENRVHRLCRQHKMSVTVKKGGRGLGQRAGPPVAEEFDAKLSDQLWLIDITEHCTGGGKLYPCAIKDAYQRACRPGHR